MTENLGECYSQMPDLGKFRRHFVHVPDSSFNETGRI